MREVARFRDMGAILGGHLAGGVRTHGRRDRMAVGEQRVSALDARTHMRRLAGP